MSAENRPLSHVNAEEVRPQFQFVHLTYFFRHVVFQVDIKGTWCVYVQGMQATGGTDETDVAMAGDTKHVRRRAAEGR